MPIQFNDLMYGALVALLILVGLMAAPMTASAQGEPAPTERDRLENLLATLEDDDARADLIEQIRTLLDVSEPEPEPMLPFLPAGESLGAQGLTYLSDRIGRVGGYATAVGQTLTDLPQIADWFVDQLENPRTRSRWIEVAVSLVVVIGAAILVRLFAKRVVRRSADAGELKAYQPVFQRLIQLCITGLLDLIPLVAFVATAYVALSVVDPTPQVRLVALAVINASAITGMIAIIARMTLTPYRPHLRLFPLENETSAYIYLWTRRLVFTAVYGYFAAEAGRALGMPLATRNTLLVAVGAAIALMSIVLVLQNRVAIGDWLRGPPPPRRRGRQSTLITLRRRFADIWHVLAIAYIVTNFTIFALDVEGGFVFMLRGTLLSIAIIILARLALSGTDFGLRYLFTVKADLAASYPMLEKRANLYIPLINRVAKATILLIASLALLEVWSLGGFTWVYTDFGRAFLSSVFSVAIILVLAIGTWELVSNAIERRLSETDEDGNPILQTGRTRTLLPLMRNAFLVILLTIVTLIVLSEIGVNIAPLLAGAGVIGLAIGFGSQALVRDVITGLFILFEDWFNVGDVVDIGGKSGVVETMTIRTVRLRDLSGNVHTIQFGDVTSATNMTKEFSYAVIDIEVAYRENTDHVVEVLQAVAATLKDDAVYGPAILEPLEVLGVDRFGDSGVAIRVRFKTLPIKQWWIAREFRRRVKLRFDELGIEIPFPHTTLYFGADKHGSAQPARVSLDQASKTRQASSGDKRRAKAAPPPEPPPSTDDYESLIQEIDQQSGDESKTRD